MNDETKAALEASIKHWEENARVDDIDDAHIGAKHCALCRIFNSRFRAKNNCNGCPVKEKTFYSWCIGTPCAEAENVYRSRDLHRFRECAHAEVEFLKGLRE